MAAPIQHEGTGAAIRVCPNRSCPGFGEEWRVVAGPPKCPDCGSTLVPRAV